MTVPLEQQIVEVEKTVRDRARRYPDLIGRGRLKQETADAKLAAMRATQTTLTWLAANEGWIRAEAQRRGREARMRAEADQLMRDEPAVAAVLAAFPGAEIVGVRDFDSHDTADAEEQL